MQTASAIVTSKEFIPIGQGCKLLINGFHKCSSDTKALPFRLDINLPMSYPILDMTKHRLYIVLFSTVLRKTA